MTAPARAYAGLFDDLPRARTSLLPGLHALQHRDGYVSLDGLRALSDWIRVPAVEVHAAASTYTELRFAPAPKGLQRVCTGLACRLNGADELLRRAEASGAPVEPVPCFFACDRAPVVEAGEPPGLQGPATGQASGTSADSRGDRPAGQERRVLARCGVIDPESLDEYRSTGGYEALARARTMSPAEVVALVGQAGLLGRGGAYFPTARKWQTAIDAPGDVFLVVNVEEGEPGVYKDRHLCEGDPHAVIEGMLIAAHALQATRVYVYINGQAGLSAERLALALGQARASGLVAENLFVELRRGAGGYVCGEESVILNSIEGHRAVPRFRPPLPAESGLWGHPTIVNNPETLANLALILRHGVEWFRSTGTEQAPGTKLLCVSGAVPRPGLVEVPFGTLLRVVVEDLAGAAPGATVAIVCGGPSGGLIPERLLDTPVLPGTLDEGGAILGAGGITVVDERISPAEVARQLTAYNAAESCGKCTPCREGTARSEVILAALDAGTASTADITLLDGLNETIRLASLCGLGQAAPNPVTSLLRHFPPNGATANGC